MSPFQRLGVAENSEDDAIIKASYRTLAMKYHPDRNPGDKAAEERFKEISQAYEQIKDASARRSYYAEHVSAFQRKRDRQSATDDFMRARKDAYAKQEQEDRAYEDIFERFHQEPESTGAPSEYILDINMLEALQGCERSLRLPHGTVDVKIPPGVQNHHVLLIKGVMPPAIPGRAPGHLKVIIKVQEDVQWERKNYDFIAPFVIDPAVAAVGGVRYLRTLEGKDVRVNVPAGLQHGDQIRLPGLGLKKAYGGRGDVFLKIVIQIPKVLTSHQRDLFEQLERSLKP